MKHRSQCVQMGIVSKYSKIITLVTMSSLPMVGLILFFELTRPVSSHQISLIDRVAHNISHHKFRSIARYADVSTVKSDVNIRLAGVSAQLVAPRYDLGFKEITETEAGQAFTGLAKSYLKVGSQAQFVTQDGHKVALKIISRNSVGDEVITSPDNMISVEQASTKRIVNFVWDQWKFSAQIEDLGEEHKLAVQKTL